MMHIVLGGRRTELEDLNRCGVKAKKIRKTGMSMIMIMMTARMYVGFIEV